MLVMCSEMSKIYYPDLVCCMSMDTYYIYAGKQYHKQFIEINMTTANGNIK